MTNRISDNIPLLVLLMVVIDSLHFVFGRLFGRYLPPAVSSFYLLAVATVQVGAYMWWRGLIRWDILRRHFFFFSVVGFLVAGATILGYFAVLYVDAGTAALLTRSSIIFALFFSLVWLKERLTMWQWAGAAVALVGVVIISFQPGDFLRLGSLLVIGAAFMYALHVAVVKKYGDDIEFANFFLYRVLFTTLFLLFVMVGQGQMMWPTGEVWFIFIGGALLNVIVSRILYYVALRKLTLSLHSIVLMLSPVATIGWGLLLFAERPSLQALLGGLAVIGGILIVNYGSKT
ncbi:MAG: DMT family transporter [Chloroflexota bacterium]